MNIRISLVLLGLCVGLLTAFQNCGAFRSISNSEGIAVIGSVEGDPVGVANSDYGVCYQNRTNDAPGMATCLNTKVNSTDYFKGDLITNCFTKVDGSSNRKLFLAICLTKNGMVVLDHRWPSQLDIDSCVSKVGEDGLMKCFFKNGILSGITQSAIKTCIDAKGVGGLEMCLRKNEFIPRKGYVYQTDVDLCLRIGTQDQLSRCLVNAQVVPETLTQDRIEDCIPVVGIDNVVKCFRARYLVPRVVMQSHISACAAAVGEANVAACLEKQGILAFFSGQTAQTFQLVIADCISKKQIVGVAQCLRAKGFLSSEIMQPHIDACYNGVGPDLTFTCLNANFANLPAAFTSNELNDCFAKNGNTAANAAKCMRNKGVLPQVPNATHFKTCARFAGEAPDSTGVKLGQVGIYNCLVASGFSLPNLNQGEIDTCLAAAGLDNVVPCLSGKGLL